jgi:hypothetical protein
MTLVTVTFLCVIASPVFGDDRPWEQERWHALNARYFPAGDDLASNSSWLKSELHTDAEHGFEYSRSLSLNLDRRFIFSIQGPLVSERAPGLAFEVRF